MTSQTGRNMPLLGLSKYKLSRRGRKLLVSDDQRTLIALPRDVPERTWAEILQKEENELVVLDIREELLEGAMRIGYDHYMVKQNALFTAHCAAQAWIKLIDWNFFRHDPGEDPSSYPPCFIPKRLESWVPDEMPDPSPKDTLSRQNLAVLEESPEEGLQKWPSSSSIDVPVIDEIPPEYWFPGKICFPEPETLEEEYGSSYDVLTGKRRRRPRILPMASGVWASVDRDSCASDLAAESELLQKVTDYSAIDVTPKPKDVHCWTASPKARHSDRSCACFHRFPARSSLHLFGGLPTTPSAISPASSESNLSALKTTTPVEGSVHGAGDSTLQRAGKKRSSIQSKSRTTGFGRPSMMAGRSRGALPPINLGDSRSRISVISDCRLRNLRLDTQYEISSEKVDTPPGETVKRKT